MLLSTSLLSPTHAYNIDIHGKEGKAKIYTSGQLQRKNCPGYMYSTLLGMRIRSGPCANTIMRMPINVSPSCAHTSINDIPDCDGHIHTYIYHENRSLSQSLALTQCARHLYTMYMYVHLELVNSLLTGGVGEEPGLKRGNALTKNRNL